MNPPMNCDPDNGRMILDDATGATFTAPSSATAIKSASLMSSSPAAQGVTNSPTDGTITVRRAGRYRFYAQIGEGLASAGAATMTLGFQRTPSGGSAAAITGCDVVAVAAATPVAQSMSASGVVDLEAGDSVNATIKASSGNVTIKKFSISLVQYTDKIQALPQ